MTYAECLKYLADLGQELRGRKFSLDTIRTILAPLGNPERQYPTAIVAGTNGKGSTAAMLASILQCSGYRTGLYTSPHLIRVNERIRVDGSEIPDEDFARSFTEVRRTIEGLLAEGKLAELPSFFELLTATAFLHFGRAAAGFVVLEVGMGGRLDATNVTEPRVAIITNVELDHQQFLGNTHAEIAWEKAGVIKPGRPVVSSCRHPDAVAVIRRRADEQGAELIETSNFPRLSNISNRAGRYAFDLALDGNCLPNLVSPLRGEFQLRNAVTAVTAAWRLSREGFNIPRSAMAEGLRKATWPGRLEVVMERPLVVLDGAHNPAGAREVAAFIKSQWPARRLRLIFAAMRDKAIAELSEILFPLAVEVYLTRPDQPRAATPDEILAATHSRPARIIVEEDSARALAKACRAASPEDVVLVCGSLFLVGAVKKALLEDKIVPGPLVAPRAVSGCR